MDPVLRHQPFLRSPPFPWVAPAVAAVSVAGRTSINDPDGVFEALRTARVGGAFWRPADGSNPWHFTPVTGSSHAEPASDEAIIAWLMGHTVVDTTGAVVPEYVIRGVALDRIGAAAYRDPFSGQAIAVLDAIAILARWRQAIEMNRPVVQSVGMAGWKRDAISQFLWDGGFSPRFVTAGEALAAPGSPGAAVAYWPSRVPPGFADAIATSGAMAWPIEDGFLRSDGLGAECRPPMSVLIDRTGGIHFDPSRSSELETILATYAFDTAILDRARRLRETIVAARLGKYGVDRGAAIDIAVPLRQRCVLAIGQVDDDLSVLRGGAGIDGNHPFLERVRGEEPDAFIIYRPHPDVVAGLRRGHLSSIVASGLVDRIESGGSLLSLVERADAVHVLSSLTGFEALLRGHDVTVHGSPFYAGWGLTRDLAAQPVRRVRRLSIDALVAGALIVAPRYRDPVTELPCEPETLVARLTTANDPPTSTLVGFRRALGATRRTFAKVRERS